MRTGSARKPPHTYRQLCRDGQWTVINIRETLNAMQPLERGCNSFKGEDLAVRVEETY